MLRVSHGETVLELPEDPAKAAQLLADHGYWRTVPTATTVYAHNKQECTFDGPRIDALRVLRAMAVLDVQQQAQHVPSQPELPQGLFERIYGSPRWQPADPRMVGGGSGWHTTIPLVTPRGAVDADIQPRFAEPGAPKDLLTVLLAVTDNGYRQAVSKWHGLGLTLRPAAYGVWQSLTYLELGEKDKIPGIDKVMVLRAPTYVPDPDSDTAGGAALVTASLFRHE